MTPLYGSKPSKLDDAITFAEAIVLVGCAIAVVIMAIWLKLHA